MLERWLQAERRLHQTIRYYMDNTQKALVKSSQILDSITESLEKDVILSKLTEYKLALNEEKEKAKKLWCTPFGKRLKFWITLACLIAITITKFCTNYTVLDSGIESTSSLKNHYDYLDLVFYGLWLVGPPLFFLYEYVFYFGKDPSYRLDSAQTADIKYCHDLGSKIWGGLAVFLSILLLVKYGIKL